MGWRNLVLELIDLPPDGYRPGGTATVDVMTRWYDTVLAPPAWVPLQHFAVGLRVLSQTPSGEAFHRDWIVRTGDDGHRLVAVELLTRDPPGSWFVSAYLIDPLPNGSGDGDSVSFVVRA